MKNFRKKKLGDILFDSANLILMMIVCFLILYPLWYTLIYSLNDGADARLGGFYWLPREFTWDNYVMVFTDGQIIDSLIVTAERTVIGTFLSVLVMGMMGYSLTKKRLVGRNFFLTFGTITLFFWGGMIPTFLLIKRLHLVDSFWSLVLPRVVNFFYVIIFMSFYREIPDAIEESAKIDGANDLVIFIRIIFGMSLPVFATVTLFMGVWYWNDYFDAILYIIRRQDLLPMQTYLYRLIQTQTGDAMGMNVSVVKSVTPMSLQMATMFITILPILAIYPVLQRYLVKGLLLGAIKG